jgi:GNAT superfamily N-acetyltransferase
MNLSIRTMTGADISAGMRLKDLAGWNQTSADWCRFLQLSPNGCFVAEVAGRAVGTTVAFTFGKVGWIAMVLVDPDSRGQRIATRLMEHALDWLQHQGVTTVRLDATELGRPVYQRLGFVDEYRLARYEGVCRAGAIMTPAEDDLFALDRQATATDRRELLQVLRAQPAVTTRVLTGGYLMDRPGSRAWQIGPCVATTEAAGLAVLDDAAQRRRGSNILIDIPLDNQPALAWAERQGLRVQRNFVRMCRGQRLTDDPAQIWAGSGPEKG